MVPKRTEPSSYGLSPDYFAPVHSDKAVTLPTYKATNQSGKFGTVAARPSIVEEHTYGAGNGTWRTIQFRVVVRPGAPLTVARKSSVALPGEGSFIVNCTRSNALVERTQNGSAEMPGYMTRSTKARVCTSTGTFMSSNTPRATCSESRRKASSPSPWWRVADCR